MRKSPSRVNLKNLGSEYTFTKFPSDYYLENIESWQLYQEEKAQLKAKYPPLDNMTQEQRRSFYKEMVTLLHTSSNLQKAFQILADEHQMYVHLPHYDAIKEDRYDAIYRGKQGRKKRL